MPTPEMPDILPTLKELRRGEASMHALISTAGKKAVVLIMKRPVPPSQRAVLQGALGVSKAIHLAAECRYEDGVLVFIAERGGADLERMVKAALLDQTKQRIDVVIREAAASTDEAPSAETPSAEAGPTRQQLKSRLIDAATRALRDRSASSTVPPLRDRIAAVSAMLDADRLAEADALLSEFEGLIAEIPAAAPIATPAAGSAVTRGTSSGGTDAVPEGVNAGAAAWQQAVASAVDQLKSLGKAIAVLKHPRGADALKELAGLRQLLTLDIGEEAHRDRIERAIDRDQVMVDVELPNGLDVTVRLREPLRKALQQLKKETATS